MILYDMVLEGLPERVRELTVRLRDIVLSLGPGLKETVGRKGLEYATTKHVVSLVPARTGVAITLAGPFVDVPAGVEGRAELSGRKLVITLASASGIDDGLRRVLRDALLSLPSHKAAPAIAPAEVAADLLEALQNVSRGLRLLIHHQQAMEKTALQRARSAEKTGSRRSHKKKAKQAPPVLVIGGPVVDAPDAKKPAAKAGAARKAAVKKPAPKKAPARKAPAKKAPAKKAAPKKQAPARKR